MDVQLSESLTEEILGSSVRGGAASEADSGHPSVAEHVEELVVDGLAVLAGHLEQLLPDLVGKTETVDVGVRPEVTPGDDMEIVDTEPGGDLQQRIRTVLAPNRLLHLSSSNSITPPAKFSVYFCLSLLCCHHHLDPNIVLLYVILA